MIEHLKTTTLWLLILISIFLTYQIWTFQPKYALLESTEYIDNTQIGEKKSLKEVIKPKQIIIHQETGSFLPINQQEFNETLSEQFFQEITVKDFSLLTNLEEHNDSHSYSELEFIFPGSIPAEVIKDIFHIAGNQQLVINEVDGVVFSLIETGAEKQVRVRIVSYKEEVAIEAVTNLSATRFEEVITSDSSSEFYQVSPYELVDYGNGFKKRVFLADKREEVSSVTYLSKPIAPEHFRQSLFSDPSFVKHYLQANGEESFTDGNRMVNVLNSGNVLSYINPSFGDITDQSSKPALISALDFLNGHGGITNPFYFDSVNSDASNEEITFRLVIDGFPVYQSNFYGVNNLFEISLKRVGGNQIEQYTRPLFYIEAEPINITKTTILPSGEEIMAILKDKSDFEQYLLTDISKGFMMIKRQSFVIFEPSWFIQYNGSWERVIVEEASDSEVLNVGLE